MPTKFIVDPNLCTACNRCAVMCHAVRGKGEAVRKVFTFNELRHPAAAFFNFTSSCMQCSDAPCANVCPSGALVMDTKSGLTIAEPNLCVGCGACVEVCSFDALVRQPDATIWKCDFCYHDDKLKTPPCVLACPTGALSWRNVDEDHDLLHTTGLPKTNLRVRYKFLPLTTSQAGLNQVQVSDTDVEFQRSRRPKSRRLGNEFPQSLYSLALAAVLAMGFVPLLTEDSDLTMTFPPVAALALVLRFTTFNKPFRALNAFRQGFGSRLSSELWMLLIYFMFNTLTVWFFSESKVAVWSMAGLSAALAWQVSRCPNTLISAFAGLQHSSAMLWNIVLFTCLLSRWFEMTAFVVLFKLLLFAYRQLRQPDTQFPSGRLTGFVRIVFSLTLPLLLWKYNPPFGVALLTGSVLIGEIADRFTFYSNRQFESPTRSIFADTLLFLQTKNQNENKT